MNCKGLGKSYKMDNNGSGGGRRHFTLRLIQKLETIKKITKNDGS